MDNNNILNLNHIGCFNFSDVYPEINERVLLGGHERNSRVGRVKELLSFTTKIVNPYASCVGGYGRNINVFFLMAEALWIWAGRKDVRFLKAFNDKMSDFSDDGINFHAPYGFRLRHWGEASIKEQDDASLHGENGGIDQIALVIKLLSEDDETRRAVMSIWNPTLDLDTHSKDLPCNDLLMLKIFENGLYLAIANRSNDLHWGLPTNVFQFSFLGQLISGILDTHYMEQLHFSHSLHVYLDNSIANKMSENYNKSFEYAAAGTLYDSSECSLIDLNFDSTDRMVRLKQLDGVINLVLELLDNFIKNKDFDYNDTHKSIIQGFSNDLWSRYLLLREYICYKYSDKGSLAKRAIIKNIEKILNDNGLEKWDIGLLARNFFYNRLGDNFSAILGKL